MSPSTAVVVGASMAGLSAARVLSDHVDHVILLERDRLSDTPTVRRGVPQGRHLHLLLTVGQQLLDGWLPGLSDELVARGAVPIDSSDWAFHIGGDYRVRADLGPVGISMSRPLLESVVRRQLLEQCANVELRDNTATEEVVVEGGRVVGVNAGGYDVRADLVVDCTGRNARLLTQLMGGPHPVPDLLSVQIDMAYRTRVVRPLSEGPDDRLTAMIAEDPDRGHRCGAIVPIEDGQSIVTLAGFHGDAAPTDPAGFTDFASALPAPDIAKVLTGTEDQSQVSTYRMPSSQWRRLDRVMQPPPGFLALGDALCSFNPIYAQGMSAAALQADALDHALTRHGVGSATLAPAYYKRAARSVAVPWQISAGGDFADPRTTGAKPFGTALANRYQGLVFRACHTSLPVARQTLRVQNLLATPNSLLTPTMLARVIAASRRSPSASA